MKVKTERVEEHIKLCQWSMEMEEKRETKIMNKTWKQ